MPAYNVRVVPASLPSSEDDVLRIYNRLSALTGVPPTRAIALASGQNVRSIEELVAEGAGIAPYRPVVIAQDVSEHTAMQILEESYSLPGVDVNTASVREYPTGELTADIIGYMGRIPAEQELELIQQGYDPAYDRIGYSGLEASLENTLAGQRGRNVWEVDVAGRTIGDPVVSVQPVPGLSVRLTIDTELQQAAEDALRHEIATLNAGAGQIVSETGALLAMNPQTGEILAMVSYPSYDNSRFARNIDVPYYLKVAADPLTPLVNHVTQSLYPPGSTWKLITSTGVLARTRHRPGVAAQRSRSTAAAQQVRPQRYRRRPALRLLAAAGTRQPQHHRRDRPKLRRLFLSSRRRQPERLRCRCFVPAGWASTICSATPPPSASARNWASNCPSRTPGECPIRTGSAASTAKTGQPATPTTPPSVRATST